MVGATPVTTQVGGGIGDERRASSIVSGDGEYRRTDGNVQLVPCGGHHTDGILGREVTNGVCMENSGSYTQGE